MKKTLKMLSFMAAASAFGIGIGYGYVVSNEPESCCPGATFAARGCETQCVTVGGYLSANYQWAQIRDHLHFRDSGREDDSSFSKHRHDHPDHLSNFYMKAIRLFVRGELCNGWSALMSVDFAGRDHRAVHWNPYVGNRLSNHEGHHHRHQIFIDRAYIEKAFCDAVLRAGYQKVNFGAEELVPDECLKTIERSIATHYFLRLGQKESLGFLKSHHGDLRHGSNNFAGRHTGLYLSGDFLCNFHYHAEIVNGFSGLRHHSSKWNNELGYFAGLSMDWQLCDADFLFGIHAGFQPQGTRRNHVEGSRHHHRGHVWGVDPYILANWNCFSFLGEFLWGHLEGGHLCREHHRSHPWGLNIIPTYMINDCWELVARFSYLNTRGNGTTIDNAFGVVPDQGTHLGSNRGSGINVASGVPFNKAAAFAIGVNFFPIQSVKTSLFYEYVRFKDPFQHRHSDNDRSFQKGHANVNSVRAQVQLVF